MTELKREVKKNERAQTAMELAIFGAVLIFIIGLIVRQGFNANQIQNVTLRAMRMALSSSFRTAHGYDINLSPGMGPAAAARNVASVLVIEDRLSPTAGKYGSLTRTPFVMAGSGSMSMNFFMPIEAAPNTFWEDENLPRLDLIVNGQHFVLTMAGFVERVFHTGGIWIDGGAPAPGPGGPLDEHWLPRCAFRQTRDAGNNIVNENIGCMVFYQQIANYSPFPEQSTKHPYCDTDPPCGVNDDCCDPAINLTALERFDVDRPGLLCSSPGVPPGCNKGPGVYGALYPRVVPNVPSVVPNPGGGNLSTWEVFAWQWYLVKAFIPNLSSATGLGINSTGHLVPQKIPFNPVPYGETIKWEENDKENHVVDLDNDFDEETIVGLNIQGNLGVVERAVYIDNGAGDVNFVRDARATGPQPGLSDDLTMWSRTNDGTYLEIREGELFGVGNGQFIRSTQKRDRVDVIQRIFQLSNDTGHLCGNGGVGPANWWDAPAGQVNAAQNPDLEVCVQSPATTCFDPGNLDRTCFDETTLKLYIRSRIEDRGGRKWITEIQ